MTLSSLLVLRDVATMRQVEEALARQVLYGGDLATNLLEIAAVEEEALTRTIAEDMRLPPAPAGELPVAIEPARLVPPDVALQHKIVPLEIDGEVLVLAVVERMPADVEDHLMFTLGLAIEQRAAPAVRVLQAITSLYGLPLDRRMRRLVARLSGAPMPPGSTPAFSIPQTIEDSDQTPREHSGRPTPPLGSPAVQPFAPTPSSAERKPPVDMDATPPSTPVGLRRSRLLQHTGPSSERPTRRRRGPLTFDAGRRDAQEASDRDVLLDLFFDFSRQFFDYSAFFLVHGDIAEGRDAFGAGATSDRLVGIGVPLDLPSLMSEVRDTRAAIVARPALEGLDAVLRTDLQRPRDAEIAIVPLVVRTRAVALFLGDCGDAGVDAAGFQQVTEFASVVGKALERIIVRRKREGAASGRAGAPRSSAPVQAPPAALSSVSARPPAGFSWPPMTGLATSTMPPPPPNLMTVRTISGPPIPREEPPELEPALVSHPQTNGGVPHPAPETEVHPALEEMDARALFDMLGWETGDEQPDVAPPSSSLAVAPHRPPTPYMTPAAPLPSVIVDLENELLSMVDRIVGGESDEAAEGELLRQGERAMRVIMARFPGPVTFERARALSLPNPPRASECGPILRLVARERRVALPFVVDRLADPDPETRGWATYLLCELPYPEAIPHALARLRDPDGPTRTAAVHAISAMAKVLPDEMREALRSLGAAGDPADRAAAMRAIGDARQSSLVPVLLAALADADEGVVAAAHEALVQLTRQDLGGDARPWLAWWQENGARHRVEWLIDALNHDVSEIRRAAGEELRLITREYFGYSSELPVRDRERARQRYHDWWITEGRARFRRR